VDSTLFLFNGESVNGMSLTVDIHIPSSTYSYILSCSLCSLFSLSHFYRYIYICFGSLSINKDRVLTHTHTPNVNIWRPWTKHYHLVRKDSQQYPSSPSSIILSSIGASIVETRTRTISEASSKKRLDFIRSLLEETRIIFFFFSKNFF
jgi:hypothetical protein